MNEMEKIMKHTLNIQLQATQGTVMRALGLIERRGFRLESCTVGDAGSDGRSMTVSVTSERPVELLKRQLERLHDVQRVELGQTNVRWAGQACMQT
jgi:acetolactate synthase small subunit